ncbi:MAG: hypothetical protein NUW00_01110, partial [Candidatus Kaiserbacteria bacterium]|nr:hypothetical protein [Candidatus Kaiserbacteria bacterium]
FYFHIFLANTMGFIPVNFSPAYLSTLETNFSNPFELPPSAGTMLFLNSHYIPDLSAYGKW